MTARRTSGRGAPQATWKDPRRRPELLKAIGAGAGVVLLTALAIFLMKPGDSTPTETPVQTPVQSQPADTSGSTDTTLPTTVSTIPAATGTTATTGAPTTTSQP